LTLLVGRQEGQMRTVKIWRWWRWSLVSLDGVAPSRMVSVSASVNLALHHKVLKFSSGTGSSGWSWKKGRKMVVCVCLPLPYNASYLSWLRCDNDDGVSNCWLARHAHTTDYFWMMTWECCHLPPLCAGELFDFLVAHGSMREKEARQKFRQVLVLLVLVHSLLACTRIC